MRLFTGFRRHIPVCWGMDSYTKAKVLCERYQCLINLARELRISALSWWESFSKAKVLCEMKISRMERTFEAFWRQVFSTKFDYTKYMCDEMHPAQDTSAWLILLESSESQLNGVVDHFLRRKFCRKWRLAVWKNTFEAFWRQVPNTESYYTK